MLEIAILSHCCIILLLTDMLHELELYIEKMFSIWSNPFELFKTILIITKLINIKKLH